MLTTRLEKIDKFYLVLVILLVALGILLIFTFRGIFTAFTQAYEIDPKEVGVELKVNNVNQEAASSWVFNKRIVPLGIRE